MSKASELLETQTPVDEGKGLSATQDNIESAMLKTFKKQDKKIQKFFKFEGALVEQGRNLPGDPEPNVDIVYKTKEGERIDFVGFAFIDKGRMIMEISKDIRGNLQPEALTIPIEF